MSLLAIGEPFALNRRMVARRVLPALVAACALFVSSMADACWDGYSAQVGNVSASGDDTTWDEATVRNHALWLGRINVLLPQDAQMVVQLGFVTLDVGSTSNEFEWHDGDYRTLFDAVAIRVGSSEAAKLRAMRTKTPVYVVQAGAFVKESRAEAWATALSQRDEAEYGFIQTGGFPADNPEAHVVTTPGKRKLHRVYVGAFLQRAEAEKLAKRLGGGAFVREWKDRG